MGVVWIKLWHIFEQVARNIANDAKAVRELRDDGTSFECDGFFD